MWETILFWYLVGALLGLGIGYTSYTALGGKTKNSKTRHLVISALFSWITVLAGAYGFLTGGSGGNGGQT